MMIPVKERGYANAFACVYNSANTLFPPEQRCDADEKLFLSQLQEDDNYIYRCGTEICGFMSYHKFREYYELTSLYVKKEYQRMQIGHQLLAHFEAQAAEDAWLIIKVLNNAYWALDFYKKHGYAVLNDEMRSLAKSWNMTEKPWEKILYKRRKV